MNDSGAYNAMADFLEKQKDQELRKSLIKDNLVTTTYERKVVKEIDERGNEHYTEIQIPKPFPELLVSDWATTNFPRNDKRREMACYKIGLAYASCKKFMEQKGVDKKGNYLVDLNPTLIFLTTINNMLLLSGKSWDSEMTDKLLRQHIKQESREFVEQRMPQGGFLAPKQ